MNLKKIGPIIAILAVVLIIAVVVITQWGNWTKSLTNFAGEQVGLTGLGDAVFESGFSTTKAPTAG